MAKKQRPAPPPPDIVARMLRWVFVLLLGYAGWHLLFPAYTPEPGTPVTPVSTAAAEKPANCQPASPFSELPSFSLFMPSYLPNLRIDDVKQGTGIPAICGQRVTMRYSYALTGALNDTQTVFSNLEAGKPTTTRLGSFRLLPGAEQAIIGMQPGAERHVLIPPPLALDNDNDPHKLADVKQFVLPADARTRPFTAQMKLLSAEPTLPLSELPLRIFDRGVSSANPAGCGDVVWLRLSVFRADGTRIYSNESGEPLRYRIGSGTAPLGVEAVLPGMRVGMMRSIILPPAFHRPLFPGTPAEGFTPFPDFPLPDKEITIVELALLPAPQDDGRTVPKQATPQTPASGTKP